MLLNNYITLVVIRKKDKIIKLYIVLVWFLAALFSLFLGFTVFIYYQYYENISRNTSYQELQNNFLKQTVYYKEIQDTLDNYSKELEKIGEFDEKIRNIANQNRTSCNMNCLKHLVFLQSFRNPVSSKPFLLRCCFNLRLSIILKFLL